MAKTSIYRIVIDKDSFVILAADVEFYAYMGEQRIYNRFDELVYEEDVADFLEHAKNGKGCFVLRMNIAEGGKPMLCCVFMEPEVIRGRLGLGIKLVNVPGLIESERILKNKTAVSSKILEAYGDELFTYYSDTDTIKIISNYNIESKETHLTLEEFETLLKSNTKEDEHGAVSEFIFDIRNEKSYFGICLTGDAFSGESAGYTVIKGAAAYENGGRSVLAGYIHKENTLASGSVRKMEFDSLTGVLSKGSVTDIVVRTIDMDKRQDISIAIIDVDYFKKVNDVFGHMMGDRILKKVASIIKEEVGDEGVVGRIGGDEFFVMFYDAHDLENARGRVRNIKNKVMSYFPENDGDRPAVTVSIGCAACPKDADNYADLFELADLALYIAKEKGRNRYVIYDREKHGVPKKVHDLSSAATRINSRGDMSPGDIMCVILDKVYSDGGSAEE